MKAIPVPMEALALATERVDVFLKSSGSRFSFNSHNHSQCVNIYDDRNFFIYKFNLEEIKM